jgi:hypothetical protein
MVQLSQALKPIQTLGVTIKSTLINMLRESIVCAACIGLLGCGSSEPKSPLVLGGTANPLPGTRTLTESQRRTLQNVITTAGDRCASIELAYLRELDSAAGVESWEVRCPEAPYAVVIRSDGTPGAVQRCMGSTFEASPCLDPYARGPRNRTPETLNPDLGKLLEPMKAKDGKTD